MAFIWRAKKISLQKIVLDMKSGYRKFSVIWGVFNNYDLSSGWPIFSENTLILYQQDLQLGSYFVKWQLVIDRGLPRFLIDYFAK